MGHFFNHRNVLPVTSVLLPVADKACNRRNVALLEEEVTYVHIGVPDHSRRQSFLQSRLSLPDVACTLIYCEGCDLIGQNSLSVV